MIAILRRFLVVQLLLFWQGGFLFYSAVVVPLGTEQLGQVGQGFMTQAVTIWLNRIGWLALLVFAWDAAIARDPKRGRRLARLGIVVVCAGLLAALHFYLHGLLSSQLDLDEMRYRTRTRFYERHWWYLMISTAHWLVMLVFAGLTLTAWRSEDRNL
jgi:hypothetical protein